MKLPLPRAELAGCLWLPRILAKARLMELGELPPDYASRFCHPTGVDGAFLGHFGLTREDVLSAAMMTDEEVVRWFVGRTSSSRAIAAWNHLAVNLGRPGFPFADRLEIGKATTYRDVDTRGLTTVFEVLEADEREH